MILAAGPSHVFPTGWHRRLLGQWSERERLRKRTSIMRFTRNGLKEIAPDVIYLANTEGLTAHAASVEIRSNSNGPEARPKPKVDKPIPATVAKRMANGWRSRLVPNLHHQLLTPAVRHDSCPSEHRRHEGLHARRATQRPRHHQAEHEREPVPAEPTGVRGDSGCAHEQQPAGIPSRLATISACAAGRVLNVDPDCILIGNGSDDILTILTRAFVPEGGLIASPTPSYILYKSLAEIQGARFQTVKFDEKWGLPFPGWLSGTNLTFVPNPNSPTGTVFPHADLANLAAAIDPLRSCWMKRMPTLPARTV
ncbi:MAG: aminotransferase class I/II-fold pyridoxal phosphate-dependent enzyme [Gemmataceae bacterium]